MTRAVVVDDSHFMRTVISDILEAGGIDVVTQATNGEQAVAAVKEHEPDVVTMDVEMPQMDGIEAVEQIMSVEPTPIMMLSAHTEDGADATFEALDKGAVDFLPKPGGEVSTEISRQKDTLVQKVESVAAGGLSQTNPPTQHTESTPITAAEEYEENPTVVIGASTGGPNVVERIMSDIPLDADLRVLIVQHMPDSFTERFARRLDAHSDYEVREAADGDRIGGGEALVARGNYHMRVSGYSRGTVHVDLTQDDRIHGVRPAIDVTMESAATTVSDSLTGVVLTGMGNDGAAGIQAIKEADGMTLAQDEDTSSVFGIPARAIETGCVDGVLPADEIAKGIIAAIRKNE